MSTLPSPFDSDGRLDLDVVRSGNYDICEDTKVRKALIDEAEAARDLRDLLRAVLEVADGGTALIASSIGIALEDPYNVPVMTRRLRGEVR